GLGEPRRRHPVDGALGHQHLVAARRIVRRDDHEVEVAAADPRVLDLDQEGVAAARPLYGDAGGGADPPAGDQQIGPGGRQWIGTRRQRPGRVGPQRRRQMRPREARQKAFLDEGEADRLGQADHLVGDADAAVMHGPDERLLHAHRVRPLLRLLVIVPRLSQRGEGTASALRQPRRHRARPCSAVSCNIISRGGNAARARSFMRHVKLDKIDRRILRDLQDDGRMTNVELAHRAGISAPPCLRRVRALEEAGLIRGYHADINTEALGYGVTIFAQVGLSSQAEPDLKAFEALVATWPEVREANMLAGETDFLLKIVAVDWDSYQRFLTTKL